MSQVIKNNDNIISITATLRTMNKAISNTLIVSDYIEKKAMWPAPDGCISTDFKHFKKSCLIYQIFENCHTQVSLIQNKILCIGCYNIHNMHSMLLT